MIPRWLVEHRRTYLPDATNRTAVTGRFLNTSREAGDHEPDGLTKDVAFNRHSMNDGHHISPSDNGVVQVGTDGIVVKLVQGLDEDALRRTLSMTTRATIGLDLNAPLPGDWVRCTAPEIYNAEQRIAAMQEDFTTWVRERCTEGHTAHRYRSEIGHVEGQVPGGDWEEMLKGGLQTALESQVIVFAVSGVSRTATHQIVRTRKAAFHQQSQRASYMGDRPEARMPESVWRNPRARSAFLAAISAAHIAYRAACEEDISYQDARFILPEGTTNYIMMEYTLREFINVYAYRGCSMFQWEIVAVMRECRRLLVEAYPWLEPYIKISCEKTSRAKDWGGSVENTLVNPAGQNHTCTFQGWERVEGQCDFPWARDSNRQFRSEAHEIGGRKKLPLELQPRIPMHSRDRSLLTETGTGMQRYRSQRSDPREWTREGIEELGRESLRRHHPSLADELDKEEGL